MQWSPIGRSSAADSCGPAAAAVRRRPRRPGRCRRLGAGPVRLGRRPGGRPPGTRRPRPRTRTAWPSAEARAASGSGRASSGPPAAPRPSKIVRQARGARNGDRIRSMKQHLSQVPHQWSSRLAAVDGEGPIAAAEHAGGSGSRRGEALGHPQLGVRAQQGEVLGRRVRRSAPAPPGTQSRTRSPFDHWWLTDTSVDRQVGRPRPTTRWTSPRRHARRARPPSRRRPR